MPIYLLDKKCRHLTVLTAFLLFFICLSYSSNTVAEPKALEEMTLLDLMNIEVVSSSKFKQDLSDVTASVYVITEEDIKRSGVSDLPQLLAMVPGLSISQVTSNSWAMGIRGSQSVFSNKMLVMIDGRSLFSPLFSGVFWEQLDLYIPDIERIEVIRGVGSTVWGANAVNGVINIITKSTLDNESAELYVNAGSHIQYDAGIRFGGQVSDDSYARFYLKTKDIGSLDYLDSDIVDDWSSDVFGVKWELFSGRDSVIVSADISKQSTNDPGLMTSRIVDKQVALSNQSVSGSLQWQRQIATDKAFTLSAQHHVAKRNSHWYSANDHMWNLEADTSFRWQDHQIVVGVSARQHSIDFDPKLAFSVNNSSGIVNSKSLILSGYIQDEWQFSEHHALIVGSKFESHRHSEAHSVAEYKADLLLPTIRYRYDLDDNYRLWASISQSARVPSIVERNIEIPLFTLPVGTPGNPLPWDFEVLSAGNADFTKEKLRSIEVGFRANITPTNSLDIVAFHNDFTDVRTFDLRPPMCTTTGQPLPLCGPTDSVTQLNNFANGGALSAFGIETSWFSRLTSYLDYSASYSYYNQVQKIVRTGQLFEDPALLTAKHQLILQLDWQVNDNLDVRLQHKYLSGIDDTGIPRVQLNEDFLDHYHALSVAAVYQLTDNLTLKVNARNLLQPIGEMWVAEFPESSVGRSQREFSVGIDVTF